jgi:anhydro-N-acetylmuramic acid kinase
MKNQKTAQRQSSARRNTSTHTPRSAAAPDQSRLAVGLISGTSADGIDAALVRLGGPAEQVRVELVQFATIAYSPAVRKRILRVAGGELIEVAEVSELNFLLGELFAEAALEVCRRARVPSTAVVVIGSHGQTVFHRGHKNLATRQGQRVVSRCQAGTGNTLQIAEPAIIAERCGVRVISDFRAADIAAGGQGAPLVPILDYLLLRDRRLGTVALNIGGIANVTVIPANARQDDVFGFDTGPGNILLDGLMRYATGGKRTFDADGCLAERGNVIQPLLAKLLRLDFFRRPPPKSTGREQFGQTFLSTYFLQEPTASLESRKSNPEESHFRDLLRTAAELTTRSIAGALRDYVSSRVRIQRLIVSGGGTHNTFLMRLLRGLLPQLTFHLSDDYGLPVDAKEAIAFAVLADRTLRGLPGNLPKVTGARRPVVLGKSVSP